MHLAFEMVKIFIVLLLFGLTRVRSQQFEPDIGEYQRIMEHRSLAYEFSQQFGNISQTDLDYPSTRLPSQQDLQCLADITQYLASLRSGKLWAVRMFDAWGTFPKGVLYGNLIDLGNFDECIGIKKSITDSYKIQGKFCIAKLPILKSFGIPSEFTIGVCLPASCSATNMDTFIKQTLQRLIGVHLNQPLVQEDTCKTAEREPFDGLTIFTIVLLSLLAAAMVLATLCDYFLYEDQKQLPILVKAFSARANTRTVFRLVEPKTNPNVIDCLNGMRCLSLIWVVYGHQYIIAAMSPNMNYIKVILWLEKPFSMFIKFGEFSVDTFLFLSGLLLVMISLRSMEKTKGKINVPLMYLHRYLRLTPVVAIAILVYMKLLPYLGNGPLFGSINFDDYQRCEQNWFWTLLYLQNYATADMCISHTWYLAVDMQLYIISPIFLICLYKWGKKAAAGIFVLMLLLSGCLFATMMTDKYPMSLQQGIVSGETQRKIYFATHTHAAPWLIGALFGYFLHANRNKSFTLSRISICLGWIISLALLFTSIFALYPAGQLRAPALSLLDQSFYYTLTRIAWPLGLCWVVFACMKGYGGLANSFLSSSMWQPLSKISYCAYIFHIVVQQTNGSRVRTNTYFSDYDVMLSFWSTFGFTLLVAYFMYIIIEAPFGVLETMLMPNRRPKPKTEIPEEPPMEPTPASSKTTLASQLEVDIETAKTNPEEISTRL